MATPSLYRRYRPKRFSEVRGQEHVVMALRNAVINGREGQAYLFSGPRGTGKTTSARILAKVLNCEHPVDGEPCCVCASCLAVETGTSFDVHELDAASNNGVDAMRDLIEKASLGTPGRHRVYILDEVHMLSKAAEAALLKTLEEPPPHVVFVLATTDPQKVSETIRSRTQHLQFHLLAMEVLEAHIRWIAADAEIELSEAALQSVLRQGGGSARDTVSALELVASSGGAAIDITPLDEFIEAFIEHDPGRALVVVADAVQQGRDPRTLTDDIVRHLRDCFLSLMAPELVQLPARRFEEVSALAARLGAAAIVRAMERLGEMLMEMRHAPDQRLLLEVALVQLTHEPAQSDVGALLGRLERLEHAVASAAAAPAAAPTPVDPTTGRATLGGRARREPSSREPAVTGVAAHPVSQPAVEPSGSTTPAVAPAASLPSAAVEGAVALWATDVLPALRGLARPLFSAAKVLGERDGRLALGVQNEATRVKAQALAGDVEAVLAHVVGAPVAITLEVDVTAHNDDNVVPLKRTAPLPLPDEEVDLSDLTDVPPADVVGPVERLMQAFPGSKELDERG